MSLNTSRQYSKSFGKKEKVLNYACQTYQLSRPSKVGAVMALIRECQPGSFEEWEQWYFEHAETTGKVRTKVTRESLQELGERLYAKITEIVIPEWLSAFQQLTLQDCIDYIFNLTLQRTYDGYIREKSVVYDGLATIFPDVVFDESDTDLDHAGDIDYLGWVGNKAFGVQIKPVTAQANFGNYSVSERMRANFSSFEQQFGGKVFIIFSLKGEIANTDVLADIRDEIRRLHQSTGT